MNGMDMPTTRNMTNNMNMDSMMIHMTFFWGKNAEVLFSGWPGENRAGMYALALAVVFALAVLVEWLYHCSLIKESSDDLSAGLIQTMIYAVRVGLAYLVMLAVMSFNGGIFLAAVVGHALGFLLFGSRVFKKSQSSGKASYLPPEN